MHELEQWVAENRDALTSAIVSSLRSLTHMSAGHATDEDIAESALTAIVESYVADRVFDDMKEQAPVVSTILGDWDAVVEAVNAYTENEDIVVEGWVLAVEPSVPRVVFGSIIPRIRVFGPDDVTPTHAVGILRRAERTVDETGVEG